MYQQCCLRFLIHMLSERGKETALWFLIALKYTFYRYAKRLTEEVHCIKIDSVLAGRMLFSQVQAYQGNSR